MKRFLQELEARMAALPPSERAELAEAYRTLVRAVGASTKAIGSRFRPSKTATLGVLLALGNTLGGGGERLVSDLRKLAPSIGPHVTALVQAL